MNQLFPLVFRQSLRSASPARAFICLALGLLLAGCSLPPAGRMNITGLDTPLVGALAVDVENVRGSVLVVADPTLAKPDVLVLRMGDGNPTPVEPFVASQIVQGDFGSVLRVVSADTARDKAPPLMIKVRVPTCDGLRVHTSAGGVEALGVGGAIDIRVTNSSPAEGGVLIDTSRAINQPCSVETSGGVIRVTVPASSELVVAGQATGGSAKLITSSARVIARKATFDTFEALIGSGQSPMSLRTAKGDVYVTIKP